MGQQQATQGLRDPLELLRLHRRPALAHAHPQQRQRTRSKLVRDRCRPTTPARPRPRRLSPPCPRPRGRPRTLLTCSTAAFDGAVRRRRAPVRVQRC